MKEAYQLNEVLLPAMDEVWGHRVVLEVVEKLSTILHFLLIVRESLIDSAAVGSSHLPPLEY